MRIELNSEPATATGQGFIVFDGDEVAFRGYLHFPFGTRLVTDDMRREFFARARRLAEEFNAR